MTRPGSVHYHQRDPQVLSEMLEFYGWAGARVLDCTANRRKMWNGLDTSSVTFMDIDPAMQPDVVGSFEDMPFDDASFDVLVFDPPHLPAAAASAKSLHQMRTDYGLGLSVNANSIAAVFPLFLAEARRVLRPDGIILAKIKDYVHNHRYRWMSVAWVNAVETAGLTPCDARMKVDPCGGNLKSGRWTKVHHARVEHCWWMVARKGQCETRR